MANKILVFDKLAFDPATNQYFQLILIDSGTSYSLYVKDVLAPTNPSLASLVNSVGAVPVIAPGGGGDVVGLGTTGTVPLWTNGPGSIIGDSVLTQVAGKLITPGDLEVLNFEATNNIIAQDILTQTLEVQASVSGSLTLPTGGITLTLGNFVLSAGTITFPDNVRQTFNPGATTPGLNVGSNAGDPSTPANGDVWYDSTGNLLRARVNGATVSIGTFAIGGSDTQLQYNNAGALGGISGATTDGASVTFGSGNLLATLPRITTGIRDANNNPLLNFTVVGSAVNGLTLSNSATANPATVGLSVAGGSDTNIRMGFTSKGAGNFVFTNGGLLAPDFGAESGTLAYGFTSNPTTGIWLNGTTLSFRLNALDQLMIPAQGANLGVLQIGNADNSIYRVATKVTGFSNGSITPASTGWMNWAGEGRLPADLTNATTTFSNLTGLTISDLQAGRKYFGRLVIKSNNSTATEGIKLDFNGGTATMTSFWAAASSGVGGTTVLGTAISTSLAGVINYSTITGETLITIDFSFVVNSIAGGTTIIPRFAENSTAIGTVTVELGSFIWLHDSPN